MPGDDLVDAQHGGPPVQGLPSKHPAEGAVVLPPHLSHNFVHGPAVQFFIGEDLQGDVVLISVPLDGFQAVVAVPGDALVDGQKDELEAVVEAGVEGLHDVGQDGRVFASGGADGYVVAAIEEVVGDDRVVDLGLKGPVETLLAEGIAGFRTLKTF